MVDSNPYRTPEDTATDTESRSASTEALRVSPWRYALALFATLSFLYFGYGFITAMIAREWQSAAISVAVSLASVPFAVNELQLRDCLTASLLVVAGVAGAIVAFIAYFAMFHFEWFNAIFNNKGGGDFGLIMSVAIGFAFGMLLGWLALSSTHLPSQSRIRDYLSPPNSGNHAVNRSGEISVFEVVKSIVRPR